jgi:hypothetical protein
METETQAGRVPALSVTLPSVDLLDLEPIVFTLMQADPDEQPLSLAEADDAVALYRCFLKMCALYPGTAIVPTRVIDRVWHAHMLDTAKYRVDCLGVFGGFLDHFPYAGLRGVEDRLGWLADFARTRTLFREHFGVELGGEAAVSVCRGHVDGADCFAGCITSAADTVRPRPQRLAAGLLEAGGAGAGG